MTWCENVQIISFCFTLKTFHNERKNNGRNSGNENVRIPFKISLTWHCTIIQNLTLFFSDFHSLPFRIKLYFIKCCVLL